MSNITFFNCEKCRKENIVDLFEQENFDIAKHKDESPITLNFKCKKCGSITWMLLDLHWDNDKLVGWNIKRTVHVSEQRKIKNGMASVQTTHKPVKPMTKKKVTETNDKYAKNDNKTDSKGMMSDKINAMNSTEHLSPERLLSAIWLGMVKLKLNAEDRAEVMNRIESIMEDKNTHKGNDKEE